jgi:platelet-activating factor acetylhydrolase IB subunit alpha
MRLQQLSDEVRQDPDWFEEYAAQVEEASMAAKPVLYWQAHEKSINDIQFSASDPRILVSVGAEGSVAVWDSSTGALDCRVMGHVGSVTSVAINPVMGEIVATGGEDHTVRLWDLRDVEPGSMSAKSSREKNLGFNLAHFTLKGHTGGISKVRFTGDGRLLASCSKDCDVRIWLPDMTNPTLLATWTAHESWIRDLQWTPDQRFLYTGSSDGLVFAWQVPRRWHVKGYHKKKKAAPKYEV